jgi:hypothetical protein
MTTKLEIKCIKKTNRFDAHDRIHEIGGSANGSKWRLTQQQAIAGIEGGTHSFYVSKNQHTVNVIVGKSWAGNKYIKTENDGDQPDNLLSLPECD